MGGTRLAAAGPRAKPASLLPGGRAELRIKATVSCIEMQIWLHGLFAWGWTNRAPFGRGHLKTLQSQAVSLAINTGPQRWTSRVSPENIVVL